jgi:VanZ family protein
MTTRAMAIVLVIFMLAALFIGGAQPLAVGLFAAPWDKLAHATFFFIFTYLLARFVGLPIALVMILALLVGAGDEIHQHFLPGREAGFDDWLADAVGAGLGLILVKWFRKEAVVK